MQHNRVSMDVIEWPRLMPHPHLTVRASVLYIALATLPAAANSSAAFSWHDRLCPLHPAVVSMAVPPREAAASWINILQIAGAGGTSTRFGVILIFPPG
jgi:hypothetical protein